MSSADYDGYIYDDDDYAAELYYSEGYATITAFMSIAYGIPIFAFAILSQKRLRIAAATQGFASRPFRDAHVRGSIAVVASGISASRYGFECCYLGGVSRWYLAPHYPTAWGLATVAFACAMGATTFAVDRKAKLASIIFFLGFVTMLASFIWFIPAGEWHNPFTWYAAVAGFACISMGGTSRSLQIHYQEQLTRSRDLRGGGGVDLPHRPASVSVPIARGNPVSAADAASMVAAGVPPVAGQPVTGTPVAGRAIGTEAAQATHVAAPIVVQATVADAARPTTVVVPATVASSGTVAAEAAGSSTTTGTIVTGRAIHPGV